MAGAFAVVLEAVPADVAQRITMALDIPTIGIGAGIHCDGQVLVVNDMLGLTEHVPPFVKRYADLARTIRAAAEEYVADVRAGRYPAVAAKSPAAT
jgi:3-methyl-2-oxobutanoate hydroxymethyltransferase